MFKRRTTRRKSRNRKPWYKEPTKKKKAEKFQDLDEIYSVITKEDKVVGISRDPYHWSTVHPCGLFSSAAEPGLKSLKELCAIELAKNIDELDSASLDYGSWSVWSLVWTKVLLFNLDSFAIYSLFASKFHNTPGFKLHVIGRYLDNTLNPKDLLLMTRNKAIDLYKVPGCNHRIENLFDKVDLIRITKSLSSLSFNPLLVLDLLSTRSDSIVFRNPAIVLNLHNLTALNLSNSIIDDNYIYNIFLRLKNSSSSKLTIILLRNCPKVTPTGVQYLIQLADFNPNSCLSYIECDHDMVKSDFKRKFETDLNGGEYINYVEGSRWFKLDREKYENELIYKLPLALKLNSLCKLFKENFVNLLKFSHILNLKDKNILDLMLHSEPFRQELIVEGLTSIWNTRIYQRSITKHTGYSYTINNKLTKDDSSPRVVEQHELIPAFDQNRPKAKKMKVRSIKPDAMSFFSN